MFCEYCGSHLTGQETECPRCHRRTSFVVQTEVFRNGRGVSVGAYKEEDVRSKLMPPAASPSHTVRHRPEGSTVQPKPSKDYGPELEEMRNSYSRLSKDYDQARRQLELTERQNEKLRRRSLAGGIALLLVSIALCLLRANRFQYVTFQPRLSRERRTAGIRLYTIYIRHTLLDIPIADRESLPGQYGLIVVLAILSHKVFRDRSTCESVSIGTIVSTGPKIVTFNTFNPTCGFYPQVHLRELLYRVRNIHFESLLFTHFAM